MRFCKARSPFVRGLRILRQPLWECLATFITSSLKQVVHIRQISLTLRETYGEDGMVYPTPETLAEAGEANLRKCGIGYRAVSLHRAAEALAEGRIRLEDGRDLNDDELLEFLCQFHGVGGEDRELCAPFRLRKTTRLSHRCLDRAEFARGLF